MNTKAMRRAHYLLYSCDNVNPTKQVVLLRSRLSATKDNPQGAKQVYRDTCAEACRQLGVVRVSDECKEENIE